MCNQHDNHNPYKNTENRVEKKNRRKSMVKGFLTTVSAGVIGSMLTLGVAPQINQVREIGATQAIQENSAINNQQINTADTSFNVQQVSTSTTSTADIIVKTSKAIVGITNFQSARQNSFPGFYQNNSETSQELESGTGSGVIYKVTDNEIFIVTNNHVIEDATKIEVTLYNEEIVTAELVGTDSLTDIAVLKVSGNFNITPLTFGNSDLLRAGDDVIAIGNPLGLDLYGTVTQGIVSANNRNLDVSTSTGTWEMKVIQTDAAINPGNSGGALINSSGELVGINSMKIADDEVEGIGFAIPSNEVKTIIEELTENGQMIRPYLGISMANLSEVPQYYLENIAGNLTEGVIITHLDESGIAAKEAGLMEEDIIVSINSEKITVADELRKYLYTDVSVGDTITIEYYRQGELKKAEVTLISNQQLLNE